MQQVQNGEITSTWRAILPDALSVRDNVLALDGLPLDHLADSYGTPLYVYDEQTLRAASRDVITAFRDLNTRISYASKACDITAIMRVFQKEGLDLDVVSAGELVAGMRAGFHPQQIHLHGNCKSEAELRMAVDLGLHAVVIDNLEEVELLRTIAINGTSPVAVMLRTTLAVEAETHPHLQTSGYSSKFGIPRGSAVEDEALGILRRTPALRLMGVHCHLGSQIVDADIYRRAAGDLVSFASALRGQAFPVEEISVGGGWAVAYRPDDTALSPKDVAALVRPIFQGSGFRLAVEPGRALVARAGLALYRVGSVKQTEFGRIIAVDGGIGDNPRPALYGSPYEAIRVRSPRETATGPATVAGRYCESGDVLARSIMLPDIRAGDILCIPMSGAYHLSMASHYNLVPEPAVISVADGHARLMVRRGTVEDLLARQLP